MEVLVVMDPVEAVHEETDTSFALMLVAQARGHRVWHCTPSDVSFADRCIRARARPATMTEGVGRPIALADPMTIEVASTIDVVLVRTDPPFGTDYLRLTHLLDLVEGTLVVNSPRGLREANEKLYACRFPDLTPPTLVSADRGALLAFALAHDGAVLKPIDGHGGRGVHALMRGDPNAHSIVDTMTDGGRRHVVAQPFLEGVYQGDKRILLLDGEPIGAINRVPTGGDFRANIGLGGAVEPTAIDAGDRRIIDRLAPSLRRDGLWFVGIDVIAGQLSEVNVTSPTGIRQVVALSGARPDVLVVEWLERHAPARSRRP